LLQPLSKRFVVQSPADDEDLFWVHVTLAPERRGVHAWQESGESSIFSGYRVLGKREFLRDTF
jgi:hypothetical protein